MHTPNSLISEINQYFMKEQSVHGITSHNHLINQLLLNTTRTNTRAHSDCNTANGRLKLLCKQKQQREGNSQWFLGLGRGIVAL